MDGKVGVQTLNAFYAVKDSRSSLFSELVQVTGVDLPAVMKISEVQEIVRRSTFTSVPKSYLNLLVAVEPVVIGDLVILDRSGKYVGVTQFDRRSYEEVRQSGVSNSRGIEVEQLLPPFDDFVKASPEVMVEASLSAAAAYYLVNERRLKASLKGKFVKYTDDVAYLAHNQGATGAAKYLMTGVLPAPKQSAKALRIFERARGSLLA